MPEPTATIAPDSTFAQLAGPRPEITASNIYLVPVPGLKNVSFYARVEAQDMGAQNSDRMPHITIVAVSKSIPPPQIYTGSEAVASANRYAAELQAQYRTHKVSIDTPVPGRGIKIIGGNPLARRS